MKRTMPKIEQYVVLICDQASSFESVTKARKQIFAQMGKSFEIVPAILHVLNYHINRAVYQSGLCWQQRLKNI